MSKTPSIMKTVTPNTSFLNENNISENTIPQRKNRHTKNNFIYFSII